MSDLLDEIVESTPVDLDALERLFRNPREVVARRELGAYKLRQPGVNERIIDCYDVPRIFNDLIAELRYFRSPRPSLNGHARAFTHVCAGCGREFTSNRRQLPNHQAWCGRPECRKVAATERSRAYRERRAQTNA